MEINLYFDNSYTQSRIEIEGKEMYTTSGSTGLFKNSMLLYKSPDKILRLEVKLKTIPPRIKIELADRDTLDLKFVDVAGMQFTCQKGADIYDIYRHRFKKYSVYKNSRQIAFMVAVLECNWVIGGLEFSDESASNRKDKYTIIADEDCDKELIIAFFLFFRISGHSDDIHKAWEKKELNENWKPKGSAGK